MLHQSLGDDVRHHLGGIVDALAAGIAERKRQALGDIVYRSGGKFFGRSRHGFFVSQRHVQSKNKMRTTRELDEA